MPSTWQQVCIVCNYVSLEKQLFVSSFKASCACTVTLLLYVLYYNYITPFYM